MQKSLVEAGVKAAVIFPDNDEAGLAHAKEVGRSLKAQGILSKIVRLPGPQKSDVSDWLNEGHTVEDLFAIIASAPIASNSDLAYDPAAAKKKETGKATYSYANLYRHFLQFPRTVKGDVMLSCPFHPDDTPSFSLNLNKGQFYCHGNCAEPHGGGIVTFVQKWYRVKHGRVLTIEEAKVVAIEADLRQTMTFAKTKEGAA